MKHLAYFILSPQLIATLIHYLCTIALPGLADWSALLEPVWLIRLSGTHGGSRCMGGMGLINTPTLLI